MTAHQSIAEPPAHPPAGASTVTSSAVLVPASSPVKTLWVAVDIGKRQHEAYLAPSSQGLRRRLRFRNNRQGLRQLDEAIQRAQSACQADDVVIGMAAPPCFPQPLGKRYAFTHSSHRPSSSELKSEIQVTGSSDTHLCRPGGLVEAAQTAYTRHCRDHSPRAFSSPRRRNLRKPCTSFIWPKTGSTIYLRSA